MRADSCKTSTVSVVLPGGAGSFPPPLDDDVCAIGSDSFITRGKRKSRGGKLENISFRFALKPHSVLGLLFTMSFMLSVCWNLLRFYDHLFYFNS